MRLNHQKKVLGFDGNPIPQWKMDEVGRPERDSEGKLINKGDLTFRDVAIMALAGQDPNETIGAELKARLYGLTVKFYKGKHLNLTAEEGAMLKERAGKTLSTLAYGRLCEWVEGDDPALPSEDEFEGDDDELEEIKAPVRRIRDNPQA